MGVILSAPVRSQLLARSGNDLYRVGVSQMQGYRVAMEDSHSVNLALKGHPDVTFVGVYDGHSGDKVAKLLGAKLHTTIDELPELDDNSLQEAVVRFDNQIGKSHIAMNGSTCCFCLVRPTRWTEGGEEGSEPRRPLEFEVTCVNVGDSRAMILRKDGQLVSLTEDHKPSLRAERARIEAAGGFVASDRVDGQLAMSRSLGDFMYKRGAGGPLQQKVIAWPDVTHETIFPGDRLLVVCDGVVERMSNDDVARFVHRTMDGELRNDPAMVCLRLNEYSLEHGSTDNHSTVLMCFEGDPQYNQQQVFFAGPFLPHAHDRMFIKAYFDNARAWGVSEDRLREWEKKVQGQTKKKTALSPTSFFKWITMLCVLWWAVSALLQMVSSPTGAPWKGQR
eukprot:Hpha_TRINITY_DN16848_c2_g2::TRINITY_DN16848_c2_g2_i1::g.153738::m.153738